MKCVICGVNNPNLATCCLQCKADLTLHHLILDLKERVLSRTQELANLKQEPYKLFKSNLILQIGALILIIILISLQIKEALLNPSRTLDLINNSYTLERKQLAGTLESINEELKLIKTEREENLRLKSQIEELNLKLSDSYAEPKD